MLKQLTGSGLSQENLVNELSKRLAARVTLGPGPTGSYTSGPAWPSGPLPGAGPSGAAELAKLISGYRPQRQKAAVPKTAKKEEKPTVPPGEPIDVDLPIEEKIERSAAAKKVE
jgi:hypothetical protein